MHLRIQIKQNQVVYECRYVYGKKYWNNCISIWASIIDKKLIKYNL